MSLITCCPACGTMFKVVPDQLKISEGWVRCGHCTNIFDATAHMVREAPQFALDAPQVRQEPEAAVAPRFATDVQSPWEPEPQPHPEPSWYREPEPSSASTAIAVEAPAREEPAPRSEPIVIPDARELEAPPPLSEVTFVQEARRRDFWKRPLVRAMLVLALLLLGAVLAAQYGMHDRDRLATAQPALMPLIERLCAPLNCRVGPPKQIEAIAIDSSSFNKLRGETYRLNFTLKNSAAMAVATPSLEVTLTDTQDQPVVRRVLAPSELGAPSAMLAAGSEWAGTVSLAVAGVPGGGRVAGYRLLAFYP